MDRWMLVAVVMLVIGALGAILGGSYVLRIYRDGASAREAGRSPDAPYLATGWRARWWSTGWRARDDSQWLEQARGDRRRLELHLEVYAGSRAVNEAHGDKALPDPPAALRQAETAYLARSGWARAPDGDQWAGEAWAAPWDISYQLTRAAALVRQRQRDAEPSGKLATPTPTPTPTPKAATS